jgi:hypothetical protein
MALFLRQRAWQPEFGPDGVNLVERLVVVFFRVLGAVLKRTVASILASRSRAFPASSAPAR